MIYNNILEIKENFETYIFDAYGVFNFGDNLSPQALETMKNLIKQGKKLYILSNSTKTVQNTMERYTKRGLFQNIHYHEILTSGQYTLDLITRKSLGIKGKKIYVIGQAQSNDPIGKIPQIFKNSDYEIVTNPDMSDFAYCGSPHINNENMTDVEPFLTEIQKIATAGLTLLCANPDRWSVEGRQLVIRPGTVAEAYERIGGKVIYYGKPNILVFERILKMSGTRDRNKVIMIGDTLGTDILGANRTGVKSCLVLENGVTENMLSERGLAIDEININSLAKSYGASPDYIAKKV